MTDAATKSVAVVINSRIRFSLVVLNHRIGLELNQPIRIDKTRHLHSRVGWPDHAEEFAMDRSDSLPVFDPRQQRSRADHLLQRCACTLQCFFDDLEAPSGLTSRITFGNRSAIWAERRRARHGHKRSDSD